MKIELFETHHICPSDIAGISHLLQSKHRAPGLSGPAMHAISAVDIVLWDIAGKTAGGPLYCPFGGARRMTIPLYASFFRYEDPEIVAERAGPAKTEGFDHIKLDESDEADTAAVRNAVGPATKPMLDSEFLEQQTAGSIDSDSKTVLAAKKALTRGELLIAACPANRIPTCFPPR